MCMYKLRLQKINYAVILTVMLTISFLASHGNVIVNVFTYYVDAVSIIMFIFVGYVLSNTTLEKYLQLKDDSSLSLLFIYYYSAFIIFSDGYLGGWSHTETIADKLTYLVVIGFAMLISIFIPLIFMAISFIQVKIMTHIVKSHQDA